MANITKCGKFWLQTKQASLTFPLRQKSFGDSFVQKATIRSKPAALGDEDVHRDCVRSKCVFIPATLNRHPNFHRPCRALIIWEFPSFPNQSLGDEVATTERYYSSDFDAVHQNSELLSWEIEKHTDLGVDRDLRWHILDATRDWMFDTIEEAPDTVTQWSEQGELGGSTCSHWEAEQVPPVTLNWNRW